MTPIKEANRIITLWRASGFGNEPIDLEMVISHVANQTSGGHSIIRGDADFDSIEGLMKKVGDGVYLISINKKIKNLGRFRFTLAHEMGHFLLHRLVCENFQCDRVALHDYSLSQFEAEANEFAAHLLMPPDIVRGCLGKKFDIETLFSLAASLNVSKQALGLRWVALANKELHGFVISRDGIIDWGRATDAAYSRGVYFKSCSEVPLRSATAALSQPGETLVRECERGIWHPDLASRETTYRTMEQDYSYTCLSFM